MVRQFDAGNVEKSGRQVYVEHNIADSVRVIFILIGFDSVVDHKWVIKLNDWLISDQSMALLVTAGQFGSPHEEGNPHVELEWHRFALN